MSFRKTLRALALGGTALAVALTASNAYAQGRVKWKMQSAFGSTLPHLGTSGPRFTKDVERLSDGKFQIKFYEPGALVPALECFDAASKGSVEACWTTPGYHTGKLGTGVAFFTAVPFGPQIGEFLAWKWHGGGNAIRDKKYAEFGLMAFDMFCIGPETSGWFKQPVGSLDELKGMKMRFFGLGARVMQKMGVSTQLLAGADIYPALEKGVIDATEFSMPDIDQNLGFYKIAKNNYYPGWHQQVSCSELLLNRDAFNKLSDQYKAMVEVATQAQVIVTYADTEAKNPAAMNNMLSQYGVTNRRWDDATLAQFEAAWREVVKEESAKDPFFKEIADSYFSFRDVYRGWGEAQSLKGTYLK
ncbi:MAG: C4-dicarboxylate ABC transporter [Gammaproteobacteria bacterium]|nr:C4-dicarboxylate ABC transporter [Gammaproteobacteria bacterium]NIM72269.1 C4-dicarboxylate ABC transporter [Gammaproteobacteria bacterium]NIN39184.1 C4-dicarboxylate ABC transporter [Gammaproteobacteria bacterium]NIO24017.1 C4-dicarboxylate ABC transporter [Gammaproteobacteria bacterium]NIO64669.1 C4-dicarboxylate ABC transporter [Gammaproteobacteria bacterium]